MLAPRWSPRERHEKVRKSLSLVASHVMACNLLDAFFEEMKVAKNRDIKKCVKVDPCYYF